MHRFRPRSCYTDCRTAGPLTDASCTLLPVLMHIQCGLLHLQAEQKASDASNQAQELLHRLQNSWTPHWLDQRLSSSQKWVSTNVLSGQGGKQNTAGRYLSLAQVKLTAFYQQAKVGFLVLLFAGAQIFAGLSSCVSAGTRPAVCNSVVMCEVCCYVMVSSPKSPHGAPHGAPHAIAHSMAKADVQYCLFCKSRTLVDFLAKMLCCLVAGCAASYSLEPGAPHTPASVAWQRQMCSTVPLCKPTPGLWIVCFSRPKFFVAAGSAATHSQEFGPPRQHCPEAWQRQMCSTAPLCKSTPGLWIVQSF